MNTISPDIACKECQLAHIAPGNMDPECKDCRNRHFDRCLEFVAKQMAGITVDQVKDEYFEHLLKGREAR